MNYAIGIDIGGTNIKSVVVSEDGEVLERANRETGDGNAEECVSRVRAQIREYETRRGTPATWLGLASPGLVARSGRSIASVTGRLSALEGLEWREHVGSGRDVPLLNDAQAALLAEARRGAAVGCENAFLLTLGTGVGGAILVGGKLMRGTLGRAGEMGHITLDVDGPRDSNNMPGSLEYAIGNHTLLERSNGRFATTRDLVEAYIAGDEIASAVWLRSVYRLACAVASFVNILDPERVILGGGIVAAGPALFGPLGSYLERVEWRPYGEGVAIVPAALGDFAGALGAAYNAMG